MGTQQGLLEKGNSYYFQSRIPSDVLPLFPAGTKPIIRERIGTKDELTRIQAKAIVQEKLADLSLSTLAFKATTFCHDGASDIL